MRTGYPRYPDIHGDTIVYVCEDDLWSVDVAGGTASRLTTGVAAASGPAISPDGSAIAYTGAEEGPAEVHLVSIKGGQSRRLTYDGLTRSQVCGWAPDGTAVLYNSSVESAHALEFRMRQVPIDGGETVELPLGRASSISYGANGVIVVGREYWKDSAHWKRYRGGTAGKLWIDPTGSGQFGKLITLNGNLSHPNVIGERVYFLSDHEGYGNVYSVTFDGTNLRRHTDHDDFYARSLSSDGARMVYHCGGKLYLLDPSQEGPREIDVHTPVTRTQRSRRFVDAATYLDSVDVTNDGSRLAVTTRGKVFSFANWAGAVTQHGDTDGIRYRLVTWLHDGAGMVAVASGAQPAESLVSLGNDGSAQQWHDDLDIGRALEIVASPTEAKIAVTNHRNELLTIDLSGDTPSKTVIESSDRGQIAGVTFSPDGKWLAYSVPDATYEEDSPDRSHLMLANLGTGESFAAAKRVLSDFQPVFDPDGKYLYFLGIRELNPVYDSIHFDLNFPWSVRPYAITLRADIAAPFVPQPAALVDQPAKSQTEDGADSEDRVAPIEIDADGITDRVVPVPVSDARYTQVFAVPGKVLLLSEPLEAGTAALATTQGAQGVLDTVDVVTGKVERIASGVSSAHVTPDGNTLLYFADQQVRVVKATEKVPETAEYNRESGWIDLSRIKVSVRPELEWPQMLREAWRLLSQNFWNADMSGVDWDAVYERYAPLVEQVSTRGELSDLLWELNGELGTSHAYEARGDYRDRPWFGQGFLGATFALADGGGYRVTKILSGDAGTDKSSPLLRPGTDIRVGDVITAVNGQPVDATTSIAQRLVNQAGQEVGLSVHRGDEPVREVSVKAMSTELDLRYRDWVESNRRAVAEATGGKVGYIHIPDMGTAGYAEFHRSYLNTYSSDALIIDVRFNGGGHVSPLILEKLSRRRIGYAHSRWSKPTPYPRESPSGPMVALSNEMAGSDGDIFCSAFKQFGLGPLIGTRTWGGVVGIFPWRPGLSDKTWVTQPEVAFHFDSVQWGVENYGVDPDIEVDNAPQDYAAGVDRQLNAAIEAALGELEQHPPHRAAPAPRPNLAAPTLPPRPND